MELNFSKTELLIGEQMALPVYFVDGTQVNGVDKAKYLGSQVSWTSPIKTAIEARKALAHSAYMKLQPLRRSILNWRTNVRNYNASVVPSFIYGLDTPTLEIGHLERLKKTIGRCLVLSTPQKMYGNYNFILFPRKKRPRIEPCRQAYHPFPNPYIDSIKTICNMLG